MYSVKRSLIAVSTLALASGLAACASDAPVNPTAVLVDVETPAAATIRATYNLTVGQAIRINPTTTSRTNRLRWTSSNGSVASVSSSGGVSARAVGTSTVTVSGTGVSESYLVNVAPVPAATVTSFSLAPKLGVTLNAGQTQQFATSTTWSDGQTRTSTVTYSATGGTISSTGLYTAGSVAGTFMVIASCACTTPAIADTAFVSVVVPQLTRLTMSPKTASVAAGATQQFALSAQWSTGSTTVPPVTWSASAGMVSASGLYTAPTTAGTYRVIVAHTNGTVRDTATVTVSSSTNTPTALPSEHTPNLPSGMTRVVDSWLDNLRSDNELNVDGLSRVGIAGPATATDAPFGSGVLQFTYPGNDAGNGEGGGFFGGVGGKKWRRVYFSMMIWVSPDYSIHTNREKFFYPVINTPGYPSSGTNIEWRLLDGDTPGGPTFGFNLNAQIDATNSFFQQSNASTVRMTKGRWVRVEMYCAINSPGQADGVWRVWLDGRIAVDFSAVRYSNQPAQGYFDGIRFTGTRGGGASEALTPPNGQVRRYDRLAFFASDN